MARYEQCDDTCTTDCGHCKGDHESRRRAVLFARFDALPKGPAPDWDDMRGE